MFRDLLPTVQKRLNRHKVFHGWGVVVWREPTGCEFEARSGPCVIKVKIEMGGGVTVTRKGVKIDGHDDTCSFGRHAEVDLITTRIFDWINKRNREATLQVDLPK